MKILATLPVLFALAAGPATAPTSQPTSPPSTQPASQVPAAALREANARIAQLEDQLRDAYRQINDLQEQLAALRKQVAAAPPAAAGRGAAAPHDNALGATIVMVEGRALRAGMTVDQVTTVLLSRPLLGWEGAQQLEKTGDETLFRWRKWGETEGDKYHAKQRMIVAQLTGTFQNGKLVSCKWTAK
jgi:hypothetical protein